MMVQYDSWWLAARVAKVHGDGTYDVIYDGKAQQQLPHAQVPGGSSAYEGKEQHKVARDKIWTPWPAAQKPTVEERAMVAAWAKGAGKGKALTRDEVISVRLYSGPGYQRINNAFLRALGNQPIQRWRQRLSQLPSFSYSATVTHLASAITKLSVLSTFEADEAEKRLYRGVSGKLDASFFEPDAQGLIAAVDAGMMSTSDARATPIHYIKGGLGVLFVLHCSEGTDAATGATHIGAVLTPLSQYPGETETLFPPLTMLQVMREDEGEGRFMIYDRTETKPGRGGEAEEVRIKEIHVRPSFV